LPGYTDEQIEKEFDKRSKNVTEDDVSNVLEKEKAILRKAHGPLAKFADKIKLFFSIIKDYANGTYKEIPWTTIAAIIGTLLYIFSPIDIIPDFLLPFGLMDDAAVVAVCLKAINNDLEKYKEWKSEHDINYKIVGSEDV
jgi:uncharacterized membrane protein YkvA (DUF1232 family)